MQPYNPSAVALGLWLLPSRYFPPTASKTYGYRLCKILVADTNSFAVVALRPGCSREAANRRQAVVARVQRGSSQLATVCRLLAASLPLAAA